MRRNLKGLVKIAGVSLMFLLVTIHFALALDPQGYGDGKYPFNDDMSSLWSIPPDDRCSITIYGETGDPPSYTDSGNYEHVHWTCYVWGFPKFDMDCYAWVCARYNTGGNDYVLVVTRMDVSCYGVMGENTVRDMAVIFTIPDNYKTYNTIRDWEIFYVDRAVPDGPYYYDVSYNDLYWEYTYTVRHANYHIDALEANDGWGSGYKKFKGHYSYGLYDQPTSASYYWAVIIESKLSEMLFLNIDFETAVNIWGAGIGFKRITFKVTHYGKTGGDGGGGGGGGGGRCYLM